MTLGMAVPRYNDGTSQYRAYGPFGPLLRQHPELRIHKGTPNGNGILCDWTWADLALCDAVFVQRPAQLQAVQIAAMAKRAGVPVWVDWDDDVSCVPPYNHYAAIFPQPQTDQYLGQLRDMADVITVTTEVLRVKAGPKARVIPNAWDDYTLGWNNTPRNKVITWRGSDTHEGDTATVLNALRRLGADPEWRWWFLGAPHWSVQQALGGPRYRQGPAWSDWVTLMRNLGDCGPFIHIVPLAPNDFNCSKSNCSWIEATAAGAVVVAPDMPEFRRPGVVNYRDESDFERVVRRLMGEFDGGKRHPGAEQSRRYVEENLLLSRVNDLRVDVLNELAAKSVPASKVVLPCKEFNLPPIDKGIERFTDSMIPQPCFDAVDDQEAVPA